MYAELHSPLPSLTVDPTGEHCCGMRGSIMHRHMRGLGSFDDALTFDTTPIYDTGGLVDPTAPASDFLFQPTDPIMNVDLSTLPPNPISPSLEAMYPQTVGTEFTSNGDGTYTNIQTGQSVPYSIAQQITAATTGSATGNLQTQGTEVSGSIVDPNTGQSISTNNLTTAAQALNAAGNLVTAAGKLTAQGQALLHSGNLYNAPSSSSGFPANISSAMSSLTSWFTQSSLVSGFPNYGVLGVALLVVGIGVSYISSRPKRRSR
jgi:hypothetical protein